MQLIARPTPFLFFTGKGGVGKTATSCAVALALADGGGRVLLVSTDPASNLDEMLEVSLGNTPRTVPGASGRLSAMNIDPEAAAEAYRRRVVAPYVGRVPEAEIARIREELSGACTIEIAAFDAFAGLLAGGAAGFDHVVFDTAPTGHTLRLLSLPRAWSGFLEHNDRGAACLGPHSGLTLQRERFETAHDALADPQRTTVVLVTRPERSALAEAARSAAELRTLGLANQRLVVNAVFRPADPSDPIAAALDRRGRQALAGLPEALAGLPRDELPLRPFNMVGLAALRGLLTGAGPEPVAATPARAGRLPSPAPLVDELAAPGRGLVLVMGKGGVGKTVTAAAVALGLRARGHSVHLTTTDPAAHLARTLPAEVPGLVVDRIDPAAEAARYVEKIMVARGRNLDAQGKALLREDLASPCTEEVAVFHAFSRIVAAARTSFVVLDTAPTGHSLLLMDATGAYHRQVLRDWENPGPGKMVTPLMRLRDAAYTKVILVTLAETTPVSEAAALQADLRRAQIEPWAWVVNQSLAATGTRDPLLARRATSELAEIARVREGGLARRLAVVPWRPDEPVGAAALEALLDPDAAA